MVRITVSCLALALLTAPAAAVKLQPEQSGPIDDLLNKLKGGSSGDAAQLGDANPLAGMAGMIPGGLPASVPGMPPMSMEQIMKTMNTAVAALNDTNVRDACFNSLAGIQTAAMEYLNGIDKRTDIFGNATSNLTESDQVEIVELLEQYSRSILNASDKMMHALLSAVKKDVMPVLPAELKQKAFPMLVMAEGALGGVMLIAGDKIDKISNMSMDEICQELVPVMDSVKGVTMLEKNLTRDLPMIEGSKAMVPMALPFIAGRTPELMPVVAKLLGNSVDVASTVGRAVEKTARKFNMQVGPLISDKLHCVFTVEGTGYHKNSKRHNHAYSAATAAQPALLSLFMAFVGARFSF